MQRSALASAPRNLHDHTIAIKKSGIRLMALQPASFCVLLLLAGCATHTEQPVPKAQNAPPARLTAPAGMRGTILAMRPVPTETPVLSRILLSGLGTPGNSARDHVFEFIVRTETGTTISIVQPQTGNLRAGGHVSIVRGAETRIDSPASD
jgi:hypothetical protein